MGNKSGYVIHDPKLLSGEPVLRGTKTPVRAIVELWRAGIRPEEIPVHMPHLTLAQIFGALAYYSDNQAEINQYILANHVPEHLIHPLLQREKVPA